MRIQNGRGRSKEPKQKKPTQHRHGKKQPVQIGDLLFDSRNEARFYLHLEQDPAVKEIELQPTFQIIPEYKVRCVRCSGTGKIPSQKTGLPVNCTLCKGTGLHKKRGNTYTADFRVTYIDGFEEVIDVKGERKQGDDVTFPFKRKLFEILTGMNLVVIRPGRNEYKGQWLRDDK